jgi:hypothetical protein
VYYCGGCAWDRDVNGILSKTGWSDCGLGCPTSLSFHNLTITSIDAGALDTTGLQHVTVLDLSFNQLTSLPVGVFDKLINLNSLSLDSNQLTTMPAGVFDLLTSLTTLRLPLASQFECFVSIPSSAAVYTSPGVAANITAYDELPRCSEWPERGLHSY